MKKLSLLAMMAMVSSMVASASTITYNTFTGAVDAAGDPVKASAQIDIGAGTITVTLINLQTGIFNAGQVLSDIFFTLSNGPTTALNTTTTPAGSLVNIGPTGVKTASADALIGWGLTSTGSTIHIDSLTSGPSQTIIGGVSGSPNASLLGNHNPFLNNQGVFTFAVAGVTANTTVTAAQFSFGTDAGNNVCGIIGAGTSCTTSSVPEPISLSLVGGGLLALGLFRKRVVA